MMAVRALTTTVLTSSMDFRLEVDTLVVVGLLVDHRGPMITGPGVMIMGMVETIVDLPVDREVDQMVRQGGLLGLLTPMEMATGRDLILYLLIRCLLWRISLGG